jgi:hypothetical protein
MGAKKNSSTPVLAKPDRQWEIDSAVRTLQEAERIKNDKFLMNGVKKSVDSLNKMMTGGSTKASPKKKK